MCDYRELNQCKITNDVCPWVYWCDKVRAWKELSKTPKECKITEKAELPKGYYRVAFEKRGFLYVRIENGLIKIKNPYDEIPIMVKAYKTKNGEWKIRK